MLPAVGMPPELSVSDSAQLVVNGLLIAVEKLQQRPLQAQDVLDAEIRCRAAARLLAQLRERLQGGG